MTTRSRIYQLLDNEELQAIIKDALGSRALISRVEPLGGGMYNTTYYVETLHPISKLVLRVAPIRQELLFDFEKKMMGVEPRIYQLMMDHQIPSPRVINHNASFTIISREYIITEFIEGSVTLNHPAIPEAAKASLWFEVGGLTSRLHAITGDRFGWLTRDGDINGSKSWADALLGYVAEITRRTSNHGVFDDHEMKRFDELFASHRSLFEINAKPALVHNDLWGPNILVKEISGQWTVAAIIDADRAMFADPESEFLLWNLESNAVKGYGKEMDTSPEGNLRRHFYKLKHNFFDAYVHKVQYDNEAEYLNNKKWALDRLRLIQEYQG
ncbi:aminoglycoside phosphotransferase family protein [Paenibacillus sp. R14(2021)]|uniref:aminoglycoside phosphotransferase family protein n=1 Tax=Paenibacillus sp. R14(2021) TaxID=2859228 RepID=UPI001C614129|nr:aminoglycoside phosphotransferase family protein [Paenibacillus sp. R14(2021)]